MTRQEAKDAIVLLITDPTNNQNTAAKVREAMDVILDNALIPDSDLPKVYRAIVTQNGIGDPVVAIIENTIGNIVWTYSGAEGLYVGTLAGAFAQGKTFVKPPTNYYAPGFGPTFFFGGGWNDADSVYISSFDQNGTGVNGTLNPDYSFLEIFVYP